MKTTGAHSGACGLTRGEVLMVIAILALLAFVWLGWVANQREKAQRTSCLGNLTIISLGFRLFASDHDDKFPWQIPTLQSGSMEFATSPQVFRHFVAASNELSTPKVLACPADKQRERVSQFHKVTEKSISYFVGLDAPEMDYEALLSGDRNIVGGTTNGAVRVLTPKTSVRWSKQIHHHQGNVALADGSGARLDDIALQSHIQQRTQRVIRLAIP